MQFLSWHTLWWETRERENEKEGKNVRGTEKSRKIQRAIIRTSTRKIKRRSRTLEINTFSRHPLFSRVLEKITSIEETLKKEKKKEREKSVQWKKIFFTFEPRSFSLARELNLCRNARNFLSQFLWTIVFDVNAKGKMLQCFIKEYHVYISWKISFNSSSCFPFFFFYLSDRFPFHHPSLTISNNNTNSTNLNSLNLFHHCHLFQ